MRLTIIIVTAIGLLLTAANVLALKPGQARQNLAPLTEFFADESGRLTYRQVLELPQDAWTTGNHTTFSFGFTTTPYWFRMPVTNDSKETQALMLEIRYARFDNLEVFVEVDGVVTRHLSGIEHPYEARTVRHRQHLFPITLEPDASAMIVIRAQTAGSFVVPITLWDESRFTLADERNTLLYGAYFGIWVMILIFNTVLYTALPNRALISFVAFVFSYGLYQLASLGFGVGEYWSQSAGLYDTVLLLSMGTAILSIMWFASNVLDLPTSHPIGHRILQVAAYPALLCMLAYPIVGYQGVLPVLTIQAVPVALIILSLGYLSAWRGNRNGLYSSIAWTVMLVGIVLQVMTRFEVIPLNFITENLASVGFILMIISLSFVVAAEIRRHEQSGTHGLLFAGEQGNERLEAMVHDRTQELESALTELSQANETLREINTMDAVTGIKNRHYFDTIFEQEWKRASRQKYAISLMMLDIDHFKAVNDKYGHLAGDEILRGVANTISSALKRPADIIARYGGEEFVAVLPYIENENALDFANQIRRRVEAATYIGDGQEIRVTMSIGVCTVTPDENDDRKDMISAADIALYEAKNNGRNQVRNAGQLVVHTGKAAS